VQAQFVVGSLAVPAGGVIGAGAGLEAVESVSTMRIFLVANCFENGLAVGATAVVHTLLIKALAIELRHC
jgi:hypothetical protein